MGEEYPERKKRYWDNHFGAIRYGVWSTGNVSEAIVEEYLEHHRVPSNQATNYFMLE